MIILEEEDTASVHTLVHSQEPEPTPKRLLPWRLTPLRPLSFIAFACSLPPFILAALNLPTIHLHTIPILIALVFGLPLYISSGLLFSRLTHAPTASKVFWKVNIIAYITCILSLWLCAAFMNGLALGSQRNVPLANFSMQRSSSSCYGIACTKLMISTAFASVEVVILALIIAVFFRWEPINPARSPDEPVIPNPLIDGRYWKIPLIFASLVFTIPPLATAILYIGSPALNMYTISTIIAYVLTIPFHIGVTILWRISCRMPSMSFQSLTTKRCITVVAILIVLWTFSTIMGGRIATSTILLNDVCGEHSENNTICEAQAQIYFMASAISSGLEVLVLSIVWVEAVFRFRRQSKHTSPSSSTPMTTVKSS